MPKPFPHSMRHDGQFDWWRATIKLPTFRNVQIGIPGLRSTSKIIRLRVEAGDDGPMDAQAVAYTYCLENQAKILDACFRGISKIAKIMRPVIDRAGWFTPERLNEIVPKIATPENLCKRVRLYEVNITDRVQKGVAYVEYSFGCAWDQEHGLMVVLLRDQLIYSGLGGDGW
jgi:hypothetical protein